VYLLQRTYRKLTGTVPQPTLSGRMAVRDRLSDIRQRITSDQPVIIDAGANVGSMTARFVSDYPRATIHAFEPNPEIAEQLAQRFAQHPQVHIYQKALGAENREIAFNVLKRHSSSSILAPTLKNHQYHPGEMETKQQITVPMVRLDSVITDEVDLLKLDLQGYELEALKGCGEWIEHIKMITSEVEFIPLYEGQPLFSDIEAYLRQHGFFLLNLYELWTHTDGQLTAGDAVFLNHRYQGHKGLR
jgi:FkbM family methyltransferase